MKQVFNNDRLTEKLMELRYNKQAALKDEKIRFFIRQNHYSELVNQDLRNQGNDTLSSQDKERWDRQINYGLVNQKKIRDAQIVVFGVGGIGSNAIMGLIYSGVNNFKIVDFDIIKLSNLNRQTLYTPKDVGKLKIDKAKERLLEINPYANIESFNIKIDYPEDLNVLNMSENNFPEDISKINNLIIWGDYIVNALDYYGAPYLINDLCVNNHKPYYWGGVNHSIGEIYSYYPIKETACMRCMFGQTSFFDKTQFLRYKKKDNTKMKGANIGSTVIVTGNFISEMILHDICGIYNPNYGKLFIYDAHCFDIHRIPVEIDKECPCQ